MKRRIPLMPEIGDGYRIALFKKGSRGEIVGWYDSVKDIQEMEKIFNGKFSYTNVNKCFSGITKSFTSLNHQCKVVPKIIKYEKANTITETFKES